MVAAPFTYIQTYLKAIEMFLRDKNYTGALKLANTLEDYYQEDELFKSFVASVKENNYEKSIEVIWLLNHECGDFKVSKK